MSVASAISTLCTVWPLMSMPMMPSAFCCASVGPSASFTPPALPRPPIFTCAFTTTLEMPSAANAVDISSASWAVLATLSFGTGTPYSAKSSLA